MMLLLLIVTVITSCLDPNKFDKNSNLMLNSVPFCPVTYPVELSIVYLKLYGDSGPSMLIDMSPSLIALSTTVSVHDTTATLSLSLNLVMIHSGGIKLLHWSGVVDVPFSHLQSFSITHISSHPSPLTVLLSSHCTPPRLYPLPHISTHEFVTKLYLRPGLICDHV